MHQMHALACRGSLSGPMKRRLLVMRFLWGLHNMIQKYAHAILQVRASSDMQADLWIEWRQKTIGRLGRLLRVHAHAYARKGWRWNETALPIAGPADVPRKRPGGSLAIHMN